MFCDRTATRDEKSVFAATPSTPEHGTALRGRTPDIYLGRLPTKSKSEPAPGFSCPGRCRSRGSARLGACLARPSEGAHPPAPTVLPGRGHAGSHDTHNDAVVGTPRCAQESSRRCALDTHRDWEPLCKRLTGLRSVVGDGPGLRRELPPPSSSVLSPLTAVRGGPRGLSLVGVSPAPCVAPLSTCRPWGDTRCGRVVPWVRRQCSLVLGHPDRVQSVAGSLRGGVALSHPLPRPALSQSRPRGTVRLPPRCVREVLRGRRLNTSSFIVSRWWDDGPRI